MTKIARKKNLSSMQLLKTFHFLLKGDYTMQELVEGLNSDEPDIVYNNSIISKYINTCRYCGLIIPKIHNRYFVTYIPFGLQLTYSEKDLLKNLQETISKNMPRKYTNIFKTFLEKINRNSDKELIKVDKDGHQNVFEQFERAVQGKRKIKLLFKNRGILECIPVKILEQEGKIFLKVYVKRYRTIDISRLSGLEILPDKFIPVKEEIVEVMYKLKSPMSKRYELRANEVKVSEDATDGSIIILNKDENKEHLISRLLRYDVCCEVIRPNYLREEMKEAIADTLRNYGE